MFEVSKDTDNEQPTDETVEPREQTSAERAAELDETFRKAARDGTLAE